MSRRRREISVFNVSFLDLMCCALGGVLLLVLVMSEDFSETVEAQQQVIEKLTDKSNQLAESREQLLQTMEKSSRQIADMQKTIERERQKGYMVPLPLAIRLDWNVATDIDLWVKGPKGEFASYKKMVTSFGYLMRDETRGVNRNWEVFYSVELMEGPYEVYCHYYGTNKGTAKVIVRAELFPNRPDPGNSKQETINLGKGRSEPGELALKFRIVRQGSSNAIRFE